MNSREASAYLHDRWHIRRSASTLAKYRCVGGGPEFRKANRDAIYEPAGLDAYAAKILSGPMRSTSESPEVAATASARRTV